MSQRRLLVVEDNPDDEQLTLRAINKLGCDLEIRVAHDGVEAAAALGLTKVDDSEHELPALAVMDIKMPKLSGLRLLEMIRENPRTRSLPVVVFSSSNEGEDVRRAVELGAVYEQKPVDYQSYMAKVQRIIQTRFLQSGTFFER